LLKFQSFLGVTLSVAGCIIPVDKANPYRSEENTQMEHLTKDTFREKVFDFENNKDWKFAGNLPCLIDFYADWCGPCKAVAPVLEELAEEYKGKIDVYKVDTEKEQELAAMFGIRSIPSLLFCPADGKPQMAMGALPKDAFVDAIKSVLLPN
jgi:thioredoxin